MIIKKNAVAGTLESADVMITIEPYESLEVKINSSVIEGFKQEITNCVNSTLSEFGVTRARVYVNDKGAFDAVIAARLETAILRASNGGQ